MKTKPLGHEILYFNPEKNQPGCTENVTAVTSFMTLVVVFPESFMEVKKHTHVHFTLYNLKALFPSPPHN